MTLRWRAWWIAIRPHTLPAGAAPVLVGAGVAITEGVFAWLPAAAALIGALLIQIGTNLANDFYDARRGVDTEERDGFTRVTQSGLLPPSAVQRGMLVTFAMALLLGTYLVWVGGIPIAVIGLLSVTAGVAYAGGPFPFGSYGLGDAFVFVFFGLVAVTGTYYVQAVTYVSGRFPLWVPEGMMWGTAVLASLPIACLTTAILVVNNLRDIETDRAAGKYTLAVFLGPRLTKLEYLLLLGTAYLVPVWLVVRHGSYLMGLPLLTLPGAGVLGWQVWRSQRNAYLNRVLSRTGQLLTVYATVFTIGLITA